MGKEKTEKDIQEEYDYKQYKRKIQEKYSDLSYINRMNFASFGRNDNPNIDRTTLRDAYKKEDVMRWFKNPDQYEKELRELSSFLYISKGIYYNMINFYSNIPALDYNVSPSFDDFDDEDKVEREYRKASKYCDDVLEKPNLRKIIKAILKDNAFYGYERKSDGDYFIQKLNPNYCRQGRLIGGQPSIEFDFSYFRIDKDKLRLYPREFVSMYNSYIDDGENWRELDYKNTMCIPLESEDYNFPALSGVSDDLIEMDDFYKYLKDSTELETNKLMIMKVPTNDEAEILVPPEVVQTFLQETADVLPKKAKIVGMPFELKAENLTQSKMQQNNGITEMEKLIASDSGISPAILSNASGATGVTTNIEVNSAYVFAIIEKIEVWLKKRLKRLCLNKYPFRVEFSRNTTVNRKEMFDMAHKMLTVGGSLRDIISAKGSNPDNYIGLLQMENMLGIKDLLQIPESIYTSSGKDGGQGGAPEKDAVDLTDAGEVSRDKG